MNTCTSAKVHTFHTPKTHPPTRSHTHIYTRKLETHTHTKIQPIAFICAALGKLYFGMPSVLLAK